MILIDTLGREIQLFRGKLSELPTLLEGQPACAYDDTTGLPSLWVGSSTGNERIQAEQYIIDDLVSNVANGALSARQGKILKDMIDAIGNGGSSVNIVDNLLSNSPISALSARQGKVLNDKIVSHADNKTDEKHIEFVNIEPVDLTNTGVVFLRQDQTQNTPSKPDLAELSDKVDGIIAESRKIITFSRSNNLNITHNTDTNFLFDYANKKNNADFAELNEYGQIKFTKTGLYLAYVSATFVNANGQRSMSFDGKRLYANAISIFPTTISNTQIIDISSTNIVKDLAVFQNSGAMLDATGSVTIVKLGDI